MFAACSRAYEVSITANPTDSEPHHPHADDAQASLRAELTRELAAGQATLEAALAAVAGADPTVRDRLRTQIGLVSSLLQQVGTASGSALGTMRAEVATIAEGASAAAQDARTSAAGDLSSGSAIAIVAQAAHNETNRVMAGMKDFDRDLKFGPNDTEADYRKREAERQSYIATEQAKHTAQGDLNASAAAVGQMVDAKAHGAGGPEFDKRTDDLIHTTEQLRAQIVRDGGSTKEFDDRLSAEVRASLKRKGLSDAQIDAQLAAHNGDPLQAAKAFLKTDDDLKQMTRDANAAGAEAEKKPTGLVASDAPQQPVAGNLSSAAALLKASGVVASTQSDTDNPAHGVTARIASAQSTVQMG